MKKIFSAIAMFLLVFAFSQEAPKAIKKIFDKASLQQKLTTENGEAVTFGKILEKHKGHVLVLDFWAGWCSDCYKALPKAKELEERNPHIDFVFLSMDRTGEAWKKAEEKFGLAGKENYWFPDGWKNALTNYVELKWIPRYIVVDQKSGIAKYYAITPDDPEIQKTIDKLTSKK